MLTLRSTQIPHDLLRRQQSERIAETARVRTTRVGGGLATIPFFRQSVIAGIVLRWSSPHSVARTRTAQAGAAVHTVRRFALAIGDALSAEDCRDRHDVFLFTAAELDALLSGKRMFSHSTRAIATLRRDAHARLSASQPPIHPLREGEYMSADDTAESGTDRRARAGPRPCCTERVPAAVGRRRAPQS